MKTWLILAMLLLVAAPAWGQSPSSFTRPVTVMSSQNLQACGSTATALRPCTDTDWIDVRGAGPLGLSLTATSSSGTAHVTALAILSLSATRPTGQEGVSGPTITISDNSEIEKYYRLVKDQAWTWVKIRVLGIFDSPADTQVSATLALVPRTP